MIQDEARRDEVLNCLRWASRCAAGEHDDTIRTVFGIDIDIRDARLLSVGVNISVALHQNT